MKMFTFNMENAYICIDTLVLLSNQQYWFGWTIYKEVSLQVQKAEIGSNNNDK